MDKEQLLKRADELLKFILNGLEQGKDFAEEQAPLLVQEVIKWGIIEHLMYVGIFSVPCIIALCFFVKGYRAYDADGNYSAQERASGLMFATGVVMLFSAVAVCINAFTVAKAYFAPRLYLLEQLRSLLH